MPEVIPEAVLLIGALFLIMAAVFLRGALAGYSYSFGALFEWFRRHLNFHVSYGFGSIRIPLGDLFGAIDKAIVGALQAGIADCEKYLSYTWYAAEKLLRYTAESIDWLARETEQTFDWMLHVKLPTWAKALALPVTWPVLVARMIAQALSHVRPEIVRAYHTVTHTVAHETVKVVRVVAGGAIALPKWVIHLPGRVTGLERDWTRLNRRVRRVEGLFAAGVAAAVIANALGIATKCLRSGNVGKTARRVCGMDTSLLDSLLVDALAIVGAISVVEFADALRGIEDEAVKILGAGIKEWPS